MLVLCETQGGASAGPSQCELHVDAWARGTTGDADTAGAKRKRGPGGPGGSGGPGGPGGGGPGGAGGHLFLRMQLSRTSERDIG